MRDGFDDPKVIPFDLFRRRSDAHGRDLCAKAKASINRACKPLSAAGQGGPRFELTDHIDARIRTLAGAERTVEMYQFLVAERDRFVAAGEREAAAVIDGVLRRFCETQHANLIELDALKNGG